MWKNRILEIILIWLILTKLLKLHFSVFKMFPFQIRIRELKNEIVFYTGNFSNKVELKTSFIKTFWVEKILYKIGLKINLFENLLISIPGERVPSFRATAYIQLQYHYFSTCHSWFSSQDLSKLLLLPKQRYFYFIN